MKVSDRFRVSFWRFEKALTPREFDVRIAPAESFYGSHTMAKSFLEMLAPAATTKKYFLPLAPPVQRPKSSFFCLHRWCKGQIVVFSVCTGGARGQKWFFEVCTAGASISKSTLAFTTLYQRHSLWIRNLILTSNSR